jgi:hypothetical protein
MSTFFITRFDDAKRDGGRDGLGLLPIWSRLARLRRAPAVTRAHFERRLVPEQSLG